MLLAIQSIARDTDYRQPLRFAKTVTATLFSMTLLHYCSIRIKREIRGLELRDQPQTGDHQGSADNAR